MKTLIEIIKSEKKYGIWRIFTSPKRLGIYILTSLILAMIFLLPVYGSVLFFYENWQVGLVVFNSIFGLISIGVWFGVPKKLGFWFGFFVGLGLFYWVGLSFRFSLMEFLIPFVMIAIALVYGVIFYLLLFNKSPIYRIFTLMIASYIHPFGFDWLVIESFFSYSVFDVDKWSFFCVILGVLGLLQVQRNYKILGACFLLIALDWGQINGKVELPLNIEVQTTHTPQDFKWQSQNINTIIQNNFYLIQKAILDKKDMIVLPETVFPMVLNNSKWFETLRILSQYIIIVAGGMREENGKIYNSTYLFDNKKFDYIDKVVLAPFGEKIPLPDFLAKPLYEKFFGQDYGLSEGKKPESFRIKHIPFRSAICYEGTSRIMYEDSPKYLILISNNGWFVPSIEPFFQRMLIKYYARVYGTTVIHSVNKSASYILSPFVLGDKNL